MPSSGTCNDVTSIRPLSHTYNRLPCGSTSQTCGTPQALYSSSFSRTAVRRSSTDRTSATNSGSASGTVPRRTRRSHPGPCRASSPAASRHKLAIPVFPVVVRKNGVQALFERDGLSAHVSEDIARAEPSVDREHLNLDVQADAILNGYVSGFAVNWRRFGCRIDVAPRSDQKQHSCMVTPTFV